MDNFKKVTKVIINVLSIILLILLAVVIYAKAVTTFSSDIRANYFGFRIFEVASGSMEPTLSVNDILLVKVSNDNLQKDDIIAYKSEDSIITHRIVMIDNEKVLVKGDANNTVDSPITKDMVIGKVVKVYPQLGVWKRILTEPKILIVLFITLLLFDAALSYKGTEKEKKPKEKKKEKKKEIEINTINNDEKKQENKELLEFTRRIDLKELDQLLNSKVDKEEKNEEVTKEEKDINKDYTIRLDLNEIQKKINKTVK